MVVVSSKAKDQPAQDIGKLGHKGTRGRASGSQERKLWILNSLLFLEIDRRQIKYIMYP